MNQIKSIMTLCTGKVIEKLILELRKPTHDSNQINRDSYLFKYCHNQIL